jgi:hypothetical protein
VFDGPLDGRIHEIKAWSTCQKMHERIELPLV